MWKGFSLRQNMQLQDFVILPKEASSLRLSEQSQSIAGVGCGAAEGDTNAVNLKDFIQDSIAPILQSIKLLSVSSYQKAYRSLEEYGFCCVHNIRVGLKARELQAGQRLVLKQKFPQEPSKAALRRMKNSPSLQDRTARWEELVIQELRKFGGVDTLARFADSALMVSFKKFDQSREVVLKIPNPYAFYEHTKLWFGDPFWLGESRSPRRNVHRVSVAQKLLRGPLIDSRRIRVPQKFLVARQGYVPAMPINDATMIIVSEKAPLIKYEDIENDDYIISDEDGSFLWQVIKESGSYDMHIQNVGVDTDKNLWMYDLEKPQVNKACSLQNLLYIPLATYLSNYMKIPLVKAALKDGDFDANQKLWAVNFLLDRNEAARAWFTAMDDLVAVFNNVPDVTDDMRDKVKTKFDEVKRRRLGESCYSQG
jgi:hypothetical protein